MKPKKIPNPYRIVFHVGHLDVKNLTNNRPRTHMSLEGNGLSVSKCPIEWIKIAQLGNDQNIYMLEKEYPHFFMAIENGTEEAIAWCLKNKYLIQKQKFCAFSTDEEGNETYFELDTREQAEKESIDIRPVNGYSFGPKGKAYWKNAFSTNIDNSLATSFAVIFHAEAHGYDGVWWNERLDISRLSAPRGVIFQHKLTEWKMTIVKTKKQTSLL